MAKSIQELPTNPSVVEAFLSEMKHAKEHLSQAAQGINPFLVAGAMALYKGEAVKVALNRSHQVWDNYPNEPKNVVWQCYAEYVGGEHNGKTTQVNLVDLKPLGDEDRARVEGWKAKHKEGLSPRHNPFEENYLALAWLEGYFGKSYIDLITDEFAGEYIITKDEVENRLEEMLLDRMAERD